MCTAFHKVLLALLCFVSGGVILVFKGFSYHTAEDFLQEMSAVGASEVTVKTGEVKCIIPNGKNGIHGSAVC
jgi:hypothetical protein